jgi:mannose-1-phosphate guanylyltransferase
MRYAVVLAGGWGERLWPMSRRERPKQLLALSGERTLVADTVERIAPLVELAGSIVMTSEAIRGRILPEIPLIDPARVIGEPRGRNTAPAIALAAHVLVTTDPDAVLAVLPADHVITDGAAFRETMEIAFRAAEAERALVTLGVGPTRPETEYGYIRAGRPAATDGALLAERFEEKPDPERARSFVDDGRYYWNSGMFIWRADRFLDEVASRLPEIASALEAVSGQPGDGGFPGQIERYYSTVPSVSVDYGVMEKADGVLVVPATFPWDDVGAWSALARVWAPDGSGNSSEGPVVAIDSERCVLYSEDGTVVVLGLSGVVVAHTPEGTLVCPVDRARDIRLVVDELKERGIVPDR